MAQRRARAGTTGRASDGEPGSAAAAADTARGRTRSGGSRVGLTRRTVEIDTPHGPARYVLDRPAASTGILLVLGHGAGGGVDAADLVAVRDAAVGAGVAVALVTQPYRVAGRRAPAPAGQLDTAWLTVLTALRRAVKPTTLVVGGRSSGARVACRTAVTGDAQRILALAFPLHPPGRPEKSRADELGTGRPTLVINGDRDPFGVPEAGGDVAVAVLPGETHALSKDVAAVAGLALPFVVSGEIPPR